MDKHDKFLQFNGKNIYFLNKDGVYYVALKPICEALKVDVRRSRDIAKNDPILGPELRNQALLVPEYGHKQARSMTCLPEEFIYGWIFTLKGKNPELVNYKKTCYRLLFNHFHGTITNRKELLVERSEVDDKIHKLKEILKEEDEKFKELSELQTKRKMLSQQLNTIDKELVNQPGLFDELRDN